MASIIIPAKDEAERLSKVLDKLNDSEHEIIVVDDGSTDNTAEIARRYKCKVISHNENKGKGYACRSGTKHASHNDLIFIDADAQLYPEEIPKLLKELKDYDLVIGTRDMKHIPFQRKITNRLSRKAIEKITGKKFDDVLCGFRAIKKDSFEKLQLKKNRYEFESEMLIEAAKKGLKITQVPVSVKYEKGRKIPIKDNLKIAWYLIRVWK